MYVIYDVRTTRLFNDKLYATDSSARGALTRWGNQQTGRDTSLFAVADSDHFHRKIELQVTRRNLMTGTEFSQPINTPIGCDPSMETYWCM
jgi:hypothetical protein